MLKTNLNTEVAVKELMDIFVDRLRNNLSSLGKAVSGNLINSLEYKIQKNNTGFTATLTAADYLEVVDKGRRPGKFPPPDQIKKWVQAKGITIGTLDQTAFVISRSIARKGIKATDVINKSFNEAFNIYKIKFAEKVAKDFEDMIDQINLKINKK